MTEGNTEVNDMAYLQYFALADGYREVIHIVHDEDWARRKAMDLLKKTNRKSVSIYSTNGFEIKYCGSVVLSGVGFKYVTGPSYDSVSRAINKNGSLRAKPSPKSFI